MYYSNQLSYVSYLVQITATSVGVEVGAAVTLTRLMFFLRRQIADRPSHETETFRAVVNQLRCGFQ